MNATATIHLANNPERIDYVSAHVSQDGGYAGYASGFGGEFNKYKDSGILGCAMTAVSACVDWCTRNEVKSLKVYHSVELPDIDAGLFGSTPDIESWRAEILKYGVKIAFEKCEPDND